MTWSFAILVTCKVADVRFARQLACRMFDPFTVSSIVEDLFLRSFFITVSDQGPERGLFLDLLPKLVPGSRSCEVHYGECELEYQDLTETSLESLEKLVEQKKRELESRLNSNEEDLENSQE